MTAFHHARTKRARAQKSDRPARERALFGQARTYGRAILILILIAPTLYGQAVTVGAVSTGALILFYSKNRYGTTPEMAFPHLAYIRTREMPFCNLCASKDGTFERENCAPKRPARFQGLDLASAISSAPEIITRPFLTAARLYIPAVPGWSRIGRYYRQKTPVAKGRGSKSMAIKPTDDSADQKNKYKCGNCCTKSRKENNVIHRHKYKLFMQMLK